MTPYEIAKSRYLIEEVHAMDMMGYRVVDGDTGRELATAIIKGDAEEFIRGLALKNMKGGELP